VDSVLCGTAYHAGFHEVILRDPLRIFHIQHEAAQGAAPEGEEELKARVARRGVPIIDYPSLVQYFYQMRRFNMPLIFSGEHWGLADLELPESVL
jgi:aspartyl/asparaginyl-tRNA synthetase